MPGDSFDAVPDTISVGNGPDADAATTVPPPDANGDSGGSADGRDSGDSGTLYAVAAASDKKLRVMPVNVAAGTLGAQMEVPSERDRQTVT